MSFCFIEDHRDTYPVQLSCAACSRSRRRGTTLGDLGRRALDQRPIANSLSAIKQVHQDSQRALWQPAYPCRAEGSGPRGEPRS